MPSLKEFRDRIASVKSTKKITSAMKLVAASKLKKAQDKAEASQPYAERMSDMLGRLIAGVKVGPGSSKLLAGTGKDQSHLLIVVTSDRGLCGGFNGSINREAVKAIKALRSEGKDVKIICVGRKGRDYLKLFYSDLIVEYFEGPGKKDLSFKDADAVATYVLQALDKGEFDMCTLLYNRFKSVIAQIPTQQQMIPLSIEEAEGEQGEDKGEVSALYEFEPKESALLDELLPKNLAIQIFKSFLDSAAGEQAARMTAMDNATRNAGDRINQLTLDYNRARQAYITKELIEIISGAEAV